MALNVQWSPQLKQALKDRKPIVALESTVIAHGLPHPDNIDTTLEMIAAIEDEGAAAALIGVMDGGIKIGFSKSDLELFATSPQVVKLNQADLGYALAKRVLGATTVAATAYCAHLAGIKVFATGGMGGVHRGAEHTFDISNDLVSLRALPIMVVASGVKSILDVSKTLEMLETLGVPIVGFGCEHLPLFYCRSKKYPLFHHIDDVNELCNFAKTHWDLGLGGILLAHPIKQEHALDEAEIESLISLAIDEGHRQSITGKLVTPFVLKQLFEMTQGRTLVANKALLVNNAKTAAYIAKQMQT